MSSPSPWELVALVLGSGGVGAAMLEVARRLMSWKVDDATAEEKRANAKKTDLDSLRGIIQELRDDKTSMVEERSLDRQRLANVEARLEKVEERERHMLTRAAVHEAWDQLAFAALLAQNPHHPPPPPLVETNELTGRGED